MNGIIEPGQSDFFESSYGQYNRKWRGRRLGRVKDILLDARLLLNPSYLALKAKAKKHPKRNILIAGVEVPSRAQDMKNVMQALSRTHHNVTAKFAPLGEGRGKFHNINACLEGVDMGGYDWLIVVDDDIAFADGFLDNFIYLAESANLQICQPAHKFRSYQSFELTLRQWGSLVRVTHFVECGPFTAFHKQIFPHVLPFPNLRWAWGTDIAWSEIARNKGFKIGIVDATPIRHLRPVAVSYEGRTATDEARAFLQQACVTQNRYEILQTVKVISNI